VLLHVLDLPTALGGSIIPIVAKKLQ